jgi:hypothetical protein
MVLEDPGRYNGGVVFFLEWPRERFLKRQTIVYKKRERKSVREIS